METKNKFKNGFTLIETLVAVAIFSMSILGLLSVMASGITNTTYAKNKIIAGYLAQEGIEYMRNIRDNDVLYPIHNGTAGWTTFTGALAACSNNSNNSCGFDGSVTPTNTITFNKCSAEATNCQLYLRIGNYDDNASTGNPSGFTRKVWMTTVNASEIKIFSEVDWRQGSNSYNIVFSENLYNWEQSTGY